MSQRPDRRRSLEAFAQPFSQDEVASIFDWAQGRLPFGLRASGRSDFYLAALVHAELAVPATLIKACISDYCRPEAIEAFTREANAWLENASEKARWTEICDTLMQRSEDADSDARWENAYDESLVDVFGAEPGLGRTLMRNTPGQDGTPWTYRVAGACADAIIEARMVTPSPTSM